MSIGGVRGSLVIVFFLKKFRIEINLWRLRPSRIPNLIPISPRAWVLETELISQTRKRSDLKNYSPPLCIILYLLRFFPSDVRRIRKKKPQGKIPIWWYLHRPCYRWRSNLDLSCSNSTFFAMEESVGGRWVKSNSIILLAIIPLN